MKEQQDAIIHEIGGKLYIEWVSGEVKKIRKATDDQTENLLARMLEASADVPAPNW